MPLLICIFTALMNQLGSCDLTLPDMGVAQCFLGSPWGDQWDSSTNETNVQGWTSFFSTPEFLYFHSILICLQATNVLCFLGTVYFLVDHWRNASVIIKSETKGNFLIVLKLFFIMGKAVLFMGTILIYGFPLRHSLVWRVYLPSHHTQEWTRRFILVQIFS